MDSSHFYSLVAQLDSENEAERLDAVYRLDPSRDKRAVSHLLRVLRDQGESPRVRGQAAENLKFSRKKKTMKTLVECCADGSAEVRFWSVFALGAFMRSRRRRKT